MTTSHTPPIGPPRERWLARARFATLVLPFLLVLAACGDSATRAPSLAPTPTAVATDPTPVASGGPPGTRLAVDASLLRYLPDQVGGFPMEFSLETSESVAGDPTLSSNAIGIAYGIAADPSGSDLVVAAVTALRDGVVSDEFFRSWRTTYDEASCAQAGGVAGHAETEIGGRTVFIGTCNGGAHTYHVYLADDRIMVSATSVGVARFGEQLVANLGG